MQLDQKQLADMKRALLPYVKSREMDSIRVYPLPADAVALIQVMGNDQARSLGIIAIA